MADLLQRVLDAHGGLDRWRGVTRARAVIRSGGALWGMKGLVQDPHPREMTVTLHEEWASVRPFGAADQKTDFTPGRIAIEKLDGTVVAERRDPRTSFAGHEETTPWDPLHRAYFNGYALWTYLTTPFLMALPGFRTTEINPIRDRGETWVGLRAEFPPELASHSQHQEFYFGDDHLLRRHDYRVDVAGGFKGVHYVHDFVEVDGFQVPTRRLAYRAGDDDRPLMDTPMVSIDLSDIAFM